MSLLQKVSDQLSNTKTTFLGLSRWKQVAIGVVTVGMVYAVYKKLKPKQKKEVKKIDYSKIAHFKAERVVHCNNKLGECCIWDDRKQLLCWIDHFGQEFWTYDPKTKQSKSYDLPEEPGSFALCEDGSLFIAFSSGPAFYDIETGKMSKKLFTFEPDVRSRMNDGRCDRFGRFIVGGVMKFHMGATNIFTKSIQTVKNIYLYGYGKRSAIYRINADLTQQTVIGDIMCANSICFSLDGKTMYFTDSFIKGIRKLDYYNDERIPDNDRVFSKKYNGFADGGVIDANGNLWSAQYGVGKIGCFDENGDVIMVVDVPEKNVTCCCFGGENLDILFITTLDETAFGMKGSGKDVGNVYAVQIQNVKGCKENRFKGRWSQIQ